MRATSFYTLGRLFSSIARQMTSEDGHRTPFLVPAKVGHEKLCDENTDTTGKCIAGNAIELRHIVRLPVRGSNMDLPDLTLSYLLAR